MHVKWAITVESTATDNKRNKKLIFKNNDAFRSYISKIINTIVDKAEDFDIVILIYNLLEYSGNYSMTSASLWNHYRDERNDDANENNPDCNYRTNNNKTKNKKKTKYKTKILGNKPADGSILEVLIPLKYLSNFWRYLDLSLINCEIELDLLWLRNYIISEISRTAAVAAELNANPPFQDERSIRDSFV